MPLIDVLILGFLIYSGDLANMVSRAFSLEDARNKRFTVFGPEKVSIPEAIMAFNKVFYPEVTKVKSMPYWMANIMALFIGKKFRYVISLFRYFENHPEEEDPAGANQLLGKPQTGLKEYFEIYRSVKDQN